MKSLSLMLLFVSLIVVDTKTFAQTKEADSIAKRYNEMMQILYAKPKLSIKTIGILVYDGYNTLDAMGPYHTLSELMGVKIFFVARQKGMVKNQRGLQIKVDTSFAEVKNLDILVIPGGALETFMQTKDTTTLNWIKAIDKESKYTTSVCTGSWILGATGLLKGKNATSNWYRADEMMSLYGAQYKKARWVKDGKYWTSAGVSAGIDMSLAIIDDLMGRRYTEAVMLDLEYDPNPPYHAGVPEKAEPIVADMMKEMYDMSLLPLIQKEQKQRLSPFKQWPALDEFHKIMSMTFHPAEEDNFAPLKANAKQLVELDSSLQSSAIPLIYKSKEMPELLEKLKAEAVALQVLVEKKKKNEVLKASIVALHDRFHQIMGKCKE